MDAVVRERAATPGVTITDVIVMALRRGLDQPDPVREGIGDIQQRVQGLIERLDAQESTRSQAVVPAPAKPGAPVTYVLEPAGWLGRFLLGRLELKPERSGLSRGS